MLKFKHIHILEQLLLESELIIIGNEISDIITFAKNNSQKEEDIMKKVDEFLSRLIENDILNKAKTDPQVLQQLSQAFLNKEWIDILNKYIDFISQILKIETTELDEMLKNGEDIELQLERIRAYKGRMAIVWEAYQTIEESNWTEEVNSLLDKIKVSFTDQKKTEAEVTKELVTTAKEKMDNTSAESEDFRKTAEDSVKVAYIISDFSNKDEDKKKPEPDIIDVEWEEVQTEMDNDVNDFKKAAEDFNKKTEGKAEKLVKRDVIIRNAIEELRNWGDLNTLESQFVKVRIMIMTDERGEIDAITKRRTMLQTLDESAKKQYMVDAIEAYLEARTRLGKYKTDLDVSRYKGVSYSPEINLPLFERTKIPITSKQMLDASRINYLLKIGTYLGTILASTDYLGDEQKNLGAQIERFRKATLPIIGRTISRTAKKTGGKEAQLKAEKWTRFLFTSAESGLDDPQSKIKGATKVGSGTVKEDAVAPGVSFQTPSSIGGMGTPVAPTQTSLGSGDNFQPKKSKKSNRNILDFNSFYKNLGKK
jgi:hypothetical protein